MKNTKHGLKTKAYKHPLYSLWQTLRHRATVCDQWNDFPTFLQDVGQRPDKARLKAIDENKPYGPGNFQWYKGKPRHYTMHETKEVVFDDGRGYFKHADLATI